MGRYNFYDESPNDFDFTDEDSIDFMDEGPDLNIEVSKIDHYDFYYDWKELQKHAGISMWDDDFISNIQLPTCITKVELLPP
jgi:hypothetical protein